MPRACSICTHPQRHAIEKTLIDGASFRDVAGRYTVSRSALERHKNDHLAQFLADNVGNAAIPLVSHIEEKRDGNRDNAVDILQQLSQQIARVNRLSDAVDLWLRDPDDPNRYDIGPRADNVSVIYTVQVVDDMPPVRRKAPLQELLDRIERNIAGTSVVSTESKYADPRELLLKAGDGLKGQLQLLSSLLEKVNNASEIERFQTAFLDAIAEVAPDVRNRILDNLHRRQPVPGLTGHRIE